MRVLDTLVQRARQFGVGRSIAVYLVIVIGLVLASELAIQGMGGSAPEAATPLLTAFGVAALVGVFVFFLFHGAVEGRERANAALAASEGRFRSLTSLSADWFWETDADHRLSWIAGGSAMLKLFGASLAYGQRPWEIGGVVASPEALAQLQAALAAREAFQNLELSRPGEAGEAAWHLISGEPHTDAAGLFCGYRGVGRDMTEMKNAARALSSAKDRLEMALDAGAVVIWESDVIAGRMILGEGWPRLLGEPATSRNLRVSELLERVHATDQPGILQASKRAVRGETASFSAEVRVRTATGNWKWVEGSGRVILRDAAGRALRMTGTAVDIDRRKRAEDAMRDAEARYRTLADLSPDAILLQSEGRIEYVNRAATAMLGASPATLLGRDSMSMVHPEDHDFVLERALYLRSGPGKSDFRERRMIRPDGGVVTLDGASVSYLERGRLVIQTVLRDISDKVRGREELAEREQRFRDVVEAAGEYVWETDPEFRYTWLSGRIEAVLGYPRADLVGRRPHDFMPLGEARVVGARLARYRERAEAFRDLVHRSVTKSGQVVWQNISGIPVRDGEGRLKGYRGTGADITAKRQAEERIQYLATRDALTGLPNRLLLADRAQQAILNAGRHKGRIAVLSLHLDRFERVSETLGHRIGDAVLRAAAERLANTLRRDDTLARVGGEEFVLLWDGTRALDDVARVAQKVLTCLGLPIVVEGHTFNIAASIGISVFPGDGQDFVELLKHADTARHAASEVGGNTYRYFSRELNTRAIERLELEHDLHRALARDEFVLHFQPVLRAGAAQGHPVDRVVGAEVLLRWNHPSRGMLEPQAFIPLAEQIGLAGAVGNWLVAHACAQFAAWADGPASGLWFALNVSGRELAATPGLAPAIAAALSANRLEGSRLSLEIAGQSLQHLGGESVAALRAVADLGVTLTIDDVGSGALNVVALRQLPARRLKVERAFIADIATHEDAAVVVQTFAAMARGLGLLFAAEGVENAAQLTRLRSLGCDEWQGPLYCEPLEAAAFEGLLASLRRAASG